MSKYLLKSNTKRGSGSLEARWKSNQTKNWIFLQSNRTAPGCRLFYWLFFILRKINGLWKLSQFLMIFLTEIPRALWVSMVNCFGCFLSAIWGNLKVMVEYYAILGKLPCWWFRIFSHFYVNGEHFLFIGYIECLWTLMDENTHRRAESHPRMET